MNLQQLIYFVLVNYVIAVAYGEKGICAVFRRTRIEIEGYVAINDNLRKYVWVIMYSTDLKFQIFLRNEIKDPKYYCMSFHFLIPALVIATTSSRALYFTRI